jgi:hypothetical protein
MPPVTCPTHGPSRPAFVCQQLVGTLHDDVVRAAHRCRDDDGSINGYCSSCADRLQAAGGTWTDEASAALGVRLICESCFGRIASINGFSELD